MPPSKAQQHLRPRSAAASPAPSHRSHSRPTTPQPQHYIPTPMLESLDTEGMTQIDPETSDELLHHWAAPTTATQPSTAGASDDNDLVENDEDAGEFEARTAESSVDWKQAREGSIAAKPWWRRPSPYWLLMISIGHTVSIGMNIAPKAEIFNSLACIVHYPETSTADTVPPAENTSPTLPLPPVLNQDDDDTKDDLFTAYLGLSTRSRHHFMGSLGLKHNATVTFPVLGPDSRPIDPVKCRKSPQVQAAAARFTTAVSITQGVLSALTTGWWGRLSDKLGRTRIMAVAMVGIIFSDVIFLVTAQYPTYVPGSYRFLILGPLVDGLLGGAPTMGATNNAYIADCTPDGTRAQIYSRFLGVSMLGFALGPLLGSLIISHTQNVLSVFYFSAVLHLAMLLIVFLLLPESLSPQAKTFFARTAEERKKQDQARDQAERDWEALHPEDEADEGASGWSRLSQARGLGGGRKGRGRMRRFRRSTFGFLAPLEVFAPKVDATGRKNWNLTFLALGNIGLMMMMGVMAFKFQYMQLAFGWGPTELGPLLSAMGGLRALHLLVILPFFVWFFKPRPAITAPPSAASDANADTLPSITPTPRSLIDSHFDLTIIFSSVLIDFFAYLGILLSSGAPSFLLCSCFASFGGGAGPALSSLALALLPSSKMSGRLFGALAVLQAIVSAVISPLLFGMTYSYFVGTFPKAVFVLALICLTTSIVSFSCIRLAPPSDDAENGGSLSAVEGEGEREALLVLSEPSPSRLVTAGRAAKVKAAEHVRGRTRITKKVSDGSAFSLRTTGGGQQELSSPISP